MVNILSKKDYELKQRHIFKTINADSKQTISTFNEIGMKISDSPDNFLVDLIHVRITLTL